jgi:hypothetical protein
LIYLSGLVESPRLATHASVWWPAQRDERVSFWDKSNAGSILKVEAAD